MNDKDRRWAETIIDYCNRIDDYLSRFDDDKEIYMSDNLYKDACALVIIQMGEFANRFSDEFREEYDGIEWSQLIGLRNITAHDYENIVDDISGKLFMMMFLKLESILKKFFKNEIRKVYNYYCTCYSISKTIKISTLKLNFFS